MPVMAFLLSAQELMVSITTDSSVVLVPGVPHKPKGDPKPEVPSLKVTLLPQIAAP